MEILEVKKIMDKVKANYQNFKDDEEYIVAEWTQRLKQYDYNEVNKELNNYILRGNKDIPRIGQLVRDLHTIKQQDDIQNIKGKFYCRWCGTEWEKLEYEQLCEERCLRLNFIAKMIDLFRIDQEKFFGKPIYKCKLRELNEGYNKFILEVIRQDNEKHLLKPLERQGIMAYYDNYLLPI